MARLTASASKLSSRYPPKYAGLQVSKIVSLLKFGNARIVKWHVVFCREVKQQLWTQGAFYMQVQFSFR